MSYITDNYAEYAQHLPTPVSDTWEDFLGYIVSYDSNGDVSLGGDLYVSGSVTVNTDLIVEGNSGHNDTSSFVDIYIQARLSAPYHYGIYWDVAPESNIYREFLTYEPDDGGGVNAFIIGNDLHDNIIKGTGLVLGQSTAPFHTTMQNNYALRGYETDDATARQIAKVNDSNEVQIGGSSVPLRFVHDGNVYGLPADTWYLTEVPLAEEIRHFDHASASRVVFDSYDGSTETYQYFSNQDVERTYYRGKNIYLSSPGGYLYISEAGSLSANNLDGHYYWGNNRQFYFRNNADNAWLNMMYTNTSDNLILGTHAGKILFEADAITTYGNAFRLRNSGGTDRLALEIDASDWIYLSNSSSPVYVNNNITVEGSVGLHDGVSTYYNVAHYNNTISGSVCLTWGESSKKNYFPAGITLPDTVSIQFLDGGTTPVNVFGWDSTNDRIEVGYDLDLNGSGITGCLDLYTSFECHGDMTFSNNKMLYGTTTTSQVRLMIGINSSNRFTLGNSVLACYCDSVFKGQDTILADGSYFKAAYSSGGTQYNVAGLNSSNELLLGDSSQNYVRVQTDMLLEAGSNLAQTISGALRTVYSWDGTNQEFGSGSYPMEIISTKVKSPDIEIGYGDAIYVTANGSAYYPAVEHNGTRLNFGSSVFPIDLLCSSLRINGSAGANANITGGVTNIVVEDGIVTSVS